MADNSSQLIITFSVQFHATSNLSLNFDLQRIHNYFVSFETNKCVFLFQLAMMFIFQNVWQKQQHLDN